MPPTGRRGMLPPGGEGPGKAMTYMGMAAAALGAIAGGFNLYEKHKDQFISGPPHSMPRRIERQILAGSSEDDDDEHNSSMLTMASGSGKSWRNTTSSYSVAAGGDFSTGHLRFFQEEYKEELNESNEEGDWERATKITKTLGMIQQVLNMRDEVSCASQVGDMETVTSISSKLGKLQRALEKRISGDQDHRDERAIESVSAKYDITNGTATSSKMEISCYADSSTSSDDFLSKEEVVALRSQLENEMKSVDTKTREGMAEWRLRYKRLKVLEEAEDVLDAIDEEGEDGEEVKGMKDRLSIIQGELFSEAPKMPAATQKKSFLGLFQGSRASHTRPTNSMRETKSSNKKKRPAPKSKVAGAHASANSRVTSRVVAKKKRADEKRSPGYDYLDVGEDIDRYKFSSISPYVVPQHLYGENPEAPCSRADMSPSSLAFTSPFGNFELPPGDFMRSKVMGFASLSSLRRFVDAAKEIASDLDWSSDESLAQLREHLPSESTLTLNHLRHLYRNVSDSRSINGHEDEIDLSRREFDIIMFCKKRSLTPIDALVMMPYRDLNGIEPIWKDLDKKVSLDLRQSTPYDIELKRKVGLLIQLEKNRPCRTSSGRTTHPPAAFVAGPASRKGNDDTIVGSRSDAQLSTSLLTGGDKLPSSSSSATATAATPPTAAAFVKSCPEYGPGWIVKGYERKSGTLKGHLDKYWFSPCGRKLRSRKEVERFLKDDVAANIEGPATNTSNKASRETYVIEKILGRKLNPSNERTEYLIRWRGYPDPTDFTFEPIENLGRRHVNEPEIRWGDSEADPEKIEVNDMQRDGKDVLLYSKLMSLETDLIDHDSGNDDDEKDQYIEEEEKEEEELKRGDATAEDGIETELLDHTAFSIDKQVQVSAASAPSAEIEASFSPESESLSATKSPVGHEEGCQLDEASISSEATRDDTGLFHE